MIAAVHILWVGVVFAGNLKPWFITHGSLQMTEYDGITDELLSVGLNQEGLEEVELVVSDPSNAVELKHLSIYNNYRGRRMGLVQWLLGGSRLMR